MISELVKTQPVDLAATLGRVKNGLDRAVDFWFRPREFETPKFYERMGVRFVKKNLLLSDLLDFGQSLVRPSSLTSLQNLDVTTRLWEAGHVSAGVICAGFATRCLIEGDYLSAGLYVGVNAVGNVYPVLVQRYNRSRIFRATKRMKEQGIHT